MTEPTKKKKPVSPPSPRSRSGGMKADLLNAEGRTDGSPDQFVQADITTQGPFRSSTP